MKDTETIEVELPRFVFLQLVKRAQKVCLSVEDLAALMLHYGLLKSNEVDREAKGA